MIISTSSNVVSAVYIMLIDVLLPAFLTYLVRIFLSSHNIKGIYKNRNHLQLSSPAPVLLVHQEMSEKRVGTIVGILSTLIVASAVAGGFSIVGISREDTVKMKAAAVIEAGSGEDVIDFTKHVSEDGTKVSKTYLLAKLATFCYTSNERDAVISAMMSGDAKDLTAIKFEPTKYLRLMSTNLTCLVKKENFVERKSLYFTRMTEDLQSLLNCTFKQKAAPGKLVKGFLDKNKECPLEIHDYWCARYETDVCAGAVSWEFGHYVLYVRFEKDKNDLSRLNPAFLHSQKNFRDKYSSISVRSFAYLISTGVEEDFTLNVDVMSKLRIQIDSDVHRIKDQAEVTDVNLVFLASTLGPALVLLSLASIITYCKWRTRVAEPGLQKCNPFYSAHDMLLCAMRQASQETSQGTSGGSEDGKGSEERVVLGVSRKMPHVGPVWESDDEGSAFYPEKELEGHITCRQPDLGSIE